MPTSSDDGDTPTLVSVTPASALRERRRLFSALERVFSVTFVDGDERPGTRDGFRLTAADAGGEPTTIDLHRGQRIEAPTGITFANSGALHEALTARVLNESRGIEPLQPGDRAEVLAATADGPVWLRRGREEVAAAVPDELQAGEPLRERMRDGEFAGLLPLVHWLRAVAPTAWAQPPLRAAFVFDDPNLHWPAYGFIRYRELTRHAAACGYTAAMAAIPRDLWFADPRAVRLFRDSNGILSLALHGNDHVKRELEQSLADDERRAMLAQAVRRATAFERRWDLQISRVMIPPHGATARDTVLQMPRLGIEAMCDSRPYPWLRQPPENEPLGGWRFVDVVDGGLPVIPRYHFQRSRDDLPLRAFLGQPLVLYGHHEDVAPGLDVLAEAAEEINSLGNVEWGTLETIARSNFETRTTGARLEVRLSAPVAAIDVPDWVEELRIHAPSLGPVNGIAVTTPNGDVVVPVEEGSTAPLAAFPGMTMLRTLRDDCIDPHAVARPPFRVWPLFRRAASELRDRALPTVRQVRGGHAAGR